MLVTREVIWIKLNMKTQNFFLNVLLGEDSIVKCFTSDIMYTPEAAALTRSRRSTDDGYELLNIDGENNYEIAAFTMNSGLILRFVDFIRFEFQRFNFRGTSFLMVVFGLAMSLLMYS